jgi:hypothetical protein
MLHVVIDSWFNKNDLVGSSSSSVPHYFSCPLAVVGTTKTKFEYSFVLGREGVAQKFFEVLFVA